MLALYFGLLVCAVMVITLIMVLIPGPMGLLTGLFLLVLVFVGTFLYSLLRKVHS